MFVLVLLPVVLFLYTPAHVTALRNVTILALLLVVAFSVRRWWDRDWLREVRVPLVLLGVLQLWLVIIALLLSPEPSASLREWIGEWFRATLVFAIAAASGRLLIADARVSAHLPAVTGAMIVLPMAILSLIHCALAIKYYTPQSYTAIYFGPSDHRANITYVVSLAIPVVLVDLYQRLCAQSRLLPVPSFVSVSLLLILLATVFTSNTRNGILVVVAVVAAWGFWVLRRMTASSRTKSGVFALLLVAAALIGGLTFAVALDDRWERLVRTASAAAEYDQYPAWHAFPDVPLPDSPDGEPLDVSAYQRIAFAIEGRRLLEDHPWGTGLGRDAFKVLVANKYSGADVSHAHIGVLDFGLSAGFPGLAILAAFLVALGHSGWSMAVRRGNALGLVLLLTVCIFSLRTLVDNTLRDHILEQFMLVFGILLATATSVKSAGSRER